MAMAQIPKIPGNLAVAGLAIVAMQPVELRNFVNNCVRSDKNESNDRQRHANDGWSSGAKDYRG